MFVHEKIDEKAEFGFQSDHTEWRKIELYFLFKIRVRSMVGTQNRQGAIRNSLQQRIDVFLGAQRGIHLVVCVEILNCGVR